METLIEVMFELVMLGVVALGALLGVKLAKSGVARRAARRAGAVGEDVAIPCRMAWKQGLGGGSFVYGQLRRAEDGAVFDRPGRRPVALPVGGRASRRPDGWRPGMQLFEYRGPGGEELRLKVHDAEADLAASLLRIPDPADFA
ncbi:hypothetical protein [Streptomyces sp. NPDC091371]|uniref:hypothetical protein n=1 Tax=Streptomyces sp. NPDC091371 TaxID=3155303 RepID=UPI00342008B7